MTHYTQLSQEERYEIYSELKSGISKTELASKLNRSRSTLYRELNRNKGQRGYRPKQAHELAQQRRYHRTSDFTDFARA